MALCFAEDWNKQASGTTGYADIATFNDSYTAAGASNSIVTTGRFADKAIQWAGTNNLQLPLTNKIGASSTVVVQFDLYTAPGEFATRDFLRCTEATTSSIHFTVRATASGAIQVLNAAAVAAVVATSAPGVLKYNIWQTIEVKVACLDSGTVTVRVDGETVINAVSGDFRRGTGNTTSLNQLIFNLSGQTGSRLGQIIVLDGTGSVLNDFIGDCRLESTIPNAAGSSTSWTASSGTALAAVQDTLGGYDSDTDYISESVANDDHLFTHDFTLTGVSTILFAYLQALTRNDGSNTINLLCKSSATTTSKAPAPSTLSTSYKWKHAVFEVDPNTAAAWASVAALDAAEFGVRCN
jgi:hypothetical protein